MSTQQESERDRLARNLNELLQELRVAQSGVQILFGFLLAVAFTARYEAADSLVHGLHLAAVLLAVLATALLTATAAWHRLLFRQRQRKEIIRSANWMTLGGLGCQAAAGIAGHLIRRFADASHWCVRAGTAAVPEGWGSLP